MTQPFAPELDLAHNRAPLYAQLSTLFRRFIETGQWPVDEQIPTNESLAGQFGVNPATIRRAIDILEAEGLVASFRRRGTFVTAQPPRRSLFRIPTDWSSAITAFDALESDWLEARNIERVASPYHKGESSKAGYRQFRRLYRRGDTPLAIEATALEQGIRKRIGDAPLRQRPTVGLIDASKGVRITRAEATIRFGIADRETADLLDAPLNASLAVVHFTAIGARSTILCESTWYMRGDQVQIAEPIVFGD